MWNQTIPMNFLYFITLKWIDSSCTWNSSFPRHDFVTSWLVLWKTLVRWIMQTCNIKNSPFLYQYITNDLTIVFKYQKKNFVKPTVANKSFCRFNFHLKVQIILWTTNYCLCFPWSERLTFLLFEKQSARYSSLIKQSLLDIAKYKWRSLKNVVKSAHNSNEYTSFSPRQPPFSPTQQTHCRYTCCLLHGVKSVHTQGLKQIKLITFTVLSKAF